MHRCFGEPLPHQLANAPRDQPSVTQKAPFSFLSGERKPYAVLAPVSKCYPPLMDRFPTCYSPVRHSASKETEVSIEAAFDLHVLGTPPAFVLSQDQTLILNLIDQHR